MNSIERFGNRADDYVKYRPGYPQGITDLLKQYINGENAIIADIGAGTGIFSELLLKNGITVIAVEPNDKMIEKAEKLLSKFNNVSFSKGTAENTKLPDNSVDGIVAAQAFHWFDKNKTRQEFKRILKPGGFAALIWNERLVKSQFEIDYENLIKDFSSDYTRVDHRKIKDEEIFEFFAPGKVELKIFPNYQQFDFDGLKGRLQSSSYMPLPGDEKYEQLMEALKTLFDKYQTEGMIRINYDTKIYVARL